MNHRLIDPPVREASPYGTHYWQDCDCGVRCFGMSLPQVWTNHTRHLYRARVRRG